MITEQDAALRAELILEYPAGDPAQGWELTDSPKEARQLARLEKAIPASST